MEMFLLQTALTQNLFEITEIHISQLLKDNDFSISSDHQMIETPPIYVCV